MEYANVQKLSDEAFRRLTGVKRKVFDEMSAVLRKKQDASRLRGGRKGRFCAEDRLLIMLEYWREYRTQFHMAQSRGVSETRIWEIIGEGEDVLIKSKKSTLPGRKALLRSDMQFEVIMIDATETPIERPKKSRNSGTPARKSATR